MFYLNPNIYRLVMFFVKSDLRYQGNQSQTIMSKRGNQELSYDFEIVELVTIRQQGGSE